MGGRRRDKKNVMNLEVIGPPYKVSDYIVFLSLTKNSYFNYPKQTIALLHQEGFCHCSKKENCTMLQIESFGDIEKNNSTALKIALATYGPVSVEVNTDPKTFKFYKDGVYDDTSCGKYICNSRKDTIRHDTTRHSLTT